MKSNVTIYKPLNEKTPYIAYCENLVSSCKGWRFSFREIYNEKLSIIIDVDLTKENDIMLIKDYLQSYKIEHIWWRLSYGDNYHNLDWMKKMYGDWKNYKYLNNINL